MSDSFIIAESGGSKTDWALVRDGVVVEERTTRSLHPSYFNDQYKRKFDEDWKDFPHWKSLPLYFFGAGCFRESGKERVLNMLNQVFELVHVRSDLHASGIALYGAGPGWLAILGTGSVLAYWNGADIQELRGGLGYETGDEGSGFYFGKLVIQAALEGELDSDELEQLERCYPTIYPDFNDPATIDRGAVSALAKDLQGNSQFERFHLQNFQLFFEKYVVTENRIDHVGIVGSYGFFQHKNLKQVAASLGIEIGKIVERPISHLIEQKGVFVD